MCLCLQGIGIDLLPRPPGCAHSYWTSARRCCRSCGRLSHVQCRYPGLRPVPRPALPEHAALLLKDENSQFQAEEYSRREKPILPSKDAGMEQKRRVHSSHGPCPGTSPSRSQSLLSSAKNRCYAHLAACYSSHVHRRRAPCQKASSIRPRRQRRIDVSPAIVASQKDSQSPKHCSTLPMCVPNTTRLFSKRRRNPRCYTPAARGSQRVLSPAPTARLLLGSFVSLRPMTRLHPPNKESNRP